MNTHYKTPAAYVFTEIGRVRWTPFDAFEVKTKDGAALLLSPNSDTALPSIVHIDEIFVAERLRRRGVATACLTTLCTVADKYGFRLDGGPIGWRGGLWRDAFVAWILRFGFQRDTSPFLAPVEDECAFYITRLPCR